MGKRSSARISGAALRSLAIAGILALGLSGCYYAPAPAPAYYAYAPAPTYYAYAPAPAYYYAPYPAYYYGPPAYGSVFIGGGWGGHYHYWH